MKRMQFEVSEEREKLYKILMKETGIRTKKDLFINAISLLGWAVEERKKGRIILSRDEENNREKELLMPVLETVRREKDDK